MASWPQADKLITSQKGGQARQVLPFDRRHKQRTRSAAQPLRIRLGNLSPQLAKLFVCTAEDDVLLARL